MGNSASSGRGHHDETVDFGHLAPQGIYTGPRDWNQGAVTQFIVERKLAPFYRPLEDYEDSWDDEQILAARKAPPEADESDPPRADPASSSSSKGHNKRPSTIKETPRHYEAAIYRGAVECPICFLYYPSNINRSRCCDQAICTECFVQIKRNEPTTTHLVSEPAACPYCVQENFGIVYTPPTWRAGLGSDGSTPPSWPESPKNTSDAAGHSSMKRRRKSFGANDPEVVTVDQIHPDWEAKLAAVRAAVARRANRRIIMRQVGDRLIPVGVTSGRVHAMPEEGTSDASDGDRGSRRSRRRQQQQDLNQFLGSMGLAGQDLEELMVMEAMRLSLLEHEAQQRKQQEEEAKKQQETGDASSATAPPNDASSSQGGSSATTPPQVVTASQTTQPVQAPAPVPVPKPITDEARSRSSTSAQSTASSPSASGHLTPPDSSTRRRHSRSRSRSGRSTPTSQYGAISAAVLSAASTASALATPEPRGDSTAPSMPAAAPIGPPIVANTPSLHSDNTPPPEPTAVPQAEIVPEVVNTADDQLGIGEGDAVVPTVDSPPTPEVLSSPPESTSNKPLLDSPGSPSPLSIVDEDTPTTAAASS
ncbi:uncharacterized protein BXZ73DRAFT_37077 [Epithele typhae]|uniref:uncharacterized protein n=1 Tax=Epithele typhae TaxID=378194 RepID=UPI0020089F0B|nr:uncharacterized protein BXZ73DRAFT_37077 [Epithele typhae]KAH9946271.1 hypothetical protein BXZ73DRAFT_37077 [Epithele typhae]